MMKSACAWLAAIALTGCATPEELAVMEQEAAYIQPLNLKCAHLGFVPGTSEHRRCVLELHRQRQAARAIIQGDGKPRRPVD